MSSSRSRPTAGESVAVIISKKPLPNEVILATSDAIHNALSAAGIPYALVGGAGCINHGSRRATADVDLAVSDRQKQRAINEICKATGFARHAISGQPCFMAGQNEYHNVDVLPASVVGSTPDSDQTIVVNQRSTLRLDRLLKSKIISYTNQTRGREQKSNDMTDIGFIIQLMQSRSIVVPKGSIEEANRAFFAYWFQANPGTEGIWQAIGLWPPTE